MKLGNELLAIAILFLSVAFSTPAGAQGVSAPIKCAIVVHDGARYGFAYGAVTCDAAQFSATRSCLQVSHENPACNEHNMVGGVGKWILVTTCEKPDGKRGFVFSDGKTLDEASTVAIMNAEEKGLDVETCQIFDMFHADDVVRRGPFPIQSAKKAAL